MLCNGLIKIFDFDNNFLKCIEDVAPQNVIKIKKNKSISNLCTFVSDVVDINNIQLIDDEWPELLHFDFKEHNLVEEQGIEKSWYTIYRVRRYDGSDVFQNFKNLV